MATERNKIQLAWEEKYIEKVNFWQEVDLLVLQDRAAVEAASASAASVDSQASMTGTSPSVVFSGTIPPDFAYETGSKVLKHSEQADLQVSSGTFQTDSAIQLARISGDKVITATGIARKEYTKKRVIATEQTKAAGFMSVNSNMFYFQYGAEYENIFAPDFIPVLAMLHAKIKHLFPNEKVQINSGYRWWNETKSIEYSPHEAGVAVDVGTRNFGSNALSVAYQIADTAWEMGLRGVFVGKTFVHIDICPDGGGYKYDGVPMYRGPESH